MPGFSELQPNDSHNQFLQSQVGPLDWTNPTPDGKYNLVVIGAGTAGLVAAAGAAGLGAKVALVEKRLMGGDCLNVGCVPSKAIISAARRATAIKNATKQGVSVGKIEVDFGSVMRRMRRLRAEISPHDSAQRFRDLGIDVFFGEARFADSSNITVGNAILPFQKALIASGARAAAPPIPGLDTVAYHTNETIFSLTNLPPRLGVVGAGPIGCELAQAFARLGSQVVLIGTESGVLPKEDRDAAAVVQTALERDGIEILNCGRDLKISGTGKNRSTIDLPSASGIKEESKSIDTLLIAVGRTPNVESLDLDKAGVAFSRKGVEIDDHFRTTNRRVFAAGDVCASYKFTHAADFMARAVIQNALFLGRKRLSNLVVPWSTYTAPELAHVGKTVTEMQEDPAAFDTFTLKFDTVDRAILDGETEGFVRVHVRKGSDQLVAATTVGTHAGELIGEFSLAITQKLGLGEIANAIHPYPTRSEAVRRIGDLYNRTRLTPRVQGWMKRWLAFGRR